MELPLPFNWFLSFFSKKDDFFGYNKKFDRSLMIPTEFPYGNSHPQLGERVIIIEYPYAVCFGTFHLYLAACPFSKVHLTNALTIHSKKPFDFASELICTEDLSIIAETYPFDSIYLEGVHKIIPLKFNLQNKLDRLRDQRILDITNPPSDLSTDTIAEDLPND